MTTNALVALLRLVPPQDVASLQESVRQAAPSYQYYAHNASHMGNPLVSRVQPRGGAIALMAQQLSALKRRGVLAIGQQCRAERALKHKYVGNYPCDEAGGQQKHKGKGEGGKDGGKKMKNKSKKKKKTKTSVNADAGAGR
jgi:hypothetical protein